VKSAASRAILSAAMLACVAPSLPGCGRSVGPAVVGAAPDLPARKPGLWRQTLENQGEAPVVTLICLDAAADRRAPLLGRRFRRGACDRYTLGRAPNGAYVSDTVCETGDGARIASHTAAAGDFASRYVVISDRAVAGATQPSANGRFRTTVTAVYEGPCPEDLQPGQTGYPDGSTGEIAEALGAGAGQP